MLVESSAPFRRARRPESPSAIIAPVGVKIVGVQEEGGAARWIFDTRTATQTGLPTGLRVAGKTITAIYDFTAYTILVDYMDGIEQGDHWDVVLPITGLTFVGGLTILPGQSGIAYE